MRRCATLSILFLFCFNKAVVSQIDSGIALYMLCNINLKQNDITAFNKTYQSFTDSNTFLANLVLSKLYYLKNDFSTADYYLEKAAASSGTNYHKPYAEYLLLRTLTKQHLQQKTDCLTIEKMRDSIKHYSWINSLNPFWSELEQIILSNCYN